MGEKVTTEKVAEILQITPARVRQLISENKIKSTKMGRDHLIDLSEVELFARRRKKAGRPKK